jgi:hypothetical protein
MRGFRLRIALLALGVVFGYGSAIAHGFGHHHCYGSHHHGRWDRDFGGGDDYDQPQKPGPSK